MAVLVLSFIEDCLLRVGLFALQYGGAFVVGCAIGQGFVAPVLKVVGWF